MAWFSLAEGKTYFSKLYTASLNGEFPVDTQPETIAGAMMAARGGGGERRIALAVNDTAGTSSRSPRGDALSGGDDNARNAHYIF